MLICEKLSFALGCAISVEALNQLIITCIPNVNNLHKLIADSLYSLYNFDNIISIRGHGLFWGIQFHHQFNLNNLQIKLLQYGYITSTSRNNTLRFSPPLTINKNILIKFFHKFSHILSNSLKLYNNSIIIPINNNNNNNKTK
jgi:acetylornithine/succinyldiaminopimelate/putrescine aminotransferase